MTAAEIIEEVKRLLKKEQNRVLKFARMTGVYSRLDPEVLGALAKQMVEARDAAEAERLREEIVRGFYGGNSHA